MSLKTGSRLRVAVIYGGRSGEHEISVRSAESVKRALDPVKYEIAEIFIDKLGKWHPAPIVPEPGANAGIDVIVPVLHGTYGEDGTVQGLFELAEIPYVGAGVLASAVAMDKAVTKRLCKEVGLPVAEYLTLTAGTFDPHCLQLPFPFPVFVKPANLGSSVGISKAKNCQELERALHSAAQYDRKLILERGIEGREFECAVLDGDEPKAMTPCEIIPSQEFYTYEDKYLLDDARIELPANLTTEETEEVKTLSVRCFNAVGCEGMARVDFLMESATGRFFVNEINTIPGFTSISMFPKMCEHSGVPYPKLIDALIDLALKRAEMKRHIRYSR